MNQKNLCRLINHLANTPDDEFDMAFYVNGPNCHDPKFISEIPDDLECGTVACLAGHIVLTFKDEINLDIEHIQDAAADWLGLDHDQSHNLFLGYWADKQFMSEITLTEAVRHLEDMIQ